MNLTVGKIPGKVLRYTVPLILTALVQLLFNAADLVVVGQFCGSASVAAVGSTTAFTHLFIELFLGFSSGVGSSTAQAIGAGDDDRVSRVVHTAFPLALLCGSVMAVTGICLSKPGLRFLNTPADILDLSTSYIQIYFLGIPAMLVYGFGAAIMNANGDTKKPLSYLTASGIANIVMNVIFVVAFRLDVVGVALATTISQCLSAALVVMNLMKRDDASHLSLRGMRIDKGALKQIVSIGLPTGLQNSLYPIANLTIQSHINAFGSLAVAGCSAATSVAGFVGAFVSNFYTTSLNFTGQNYGAGKIKRIYSQAKYCLLFSTIIGGVVSVLAILFARPLLGIYLTDSPAAIEEGLKKVYVMFPFYVVTGLTGVLTGILRGTGVSVPPMLASIFSIFCVRMLWLLIMVRILGYNNLYVINASFSVSWTVQAILVFFIYLYYKKKLLVPKEGEVPPVPSLKE